MPLLNVVKIGDTYHCEELDPAEWTRFPDLREVSEDELATIRLLTAGNAGRSKNVLQALLKQVHDRPEVDAEKHGQ